jgi:hypothetical protein
MELGYGESGPFVTAHSPTASDKIRPKALRSPERIVMSAVHEQKLTVEEYLAIERAAEFKSEYFDGAMYAMQGPGGPLIAKTGLDGTFSFHSIPVSVPMTAIYDGVSFPDETSPR